MTNKSPAPIDSAKAVDAERIAFLEVELASATRMFHDACHDLGLINEALGLDPEDGGADPILDAIAELKSAAPATIDSAKVEDTGEPWQVGDDTSSVQISRDGSTHKWGCKCEGCAPTGWKLVPIEPTHEMLVAAAQAKYDGDWQCKQENRYQAMLAAAPALPEPVACPECGGSGWTWKCTCTPMWTGFALSTAPTTGSAPEPVAYLSTDPKFWGGCRIRKEGTFTVPVYAAPASPAASVLTDEQIREIFRRETGTEEQDSPLAILDFAYGLLAASIGRDKP